MYGVLIGIILVLGGGGYWYYDSTQAELVSLKTHNAALESAIETQKETMSQMQEAAALQSESINELTIANQEAEREMNRYLGIFARHNLTKLAAAKPGLIETRVNRGTKDVFDSIENASRAIDNLDDGVSVVAPAGTRDSDTDEVSKGTDNSASSTSGD